MPNPPLEFHKLDGAPHCDDWNLCTGQEFSLVGEEFHQHHTCLFCDLPRFDFVSEHWPDIHSVFCLDREGGYWNPNCKEPCFVRFQHGYNVEHSLIIQYKPRFEGGKDAVAFELKNWLENIHTRR